MVLRKNNQKTVITEHVMSMDKDQVLRFEKDYETSEVYEYTEYLIRFDMPYGTVTWTFSTADARNEAWEYIHSIAEAIIITDNSIDYVGKV